MESEGRKLHNQAAQAREAGEHLKALQLSDEAMLAYQRDDDKLGFAEVLADRSISLRHLWEATNDKVFLVKAKHESMAAVEIAETTDRTALPVPQFNLAKIQEELGELPKAVSNYRLAVENIANNTPESHSNRSAIIADYKVHLATCEYKNGDKSALDRAEQALTEIETSDEEKYNKDVWSSGGHMKIADILQKDNPEKAREHLQKAKTIIDSNPDLKLRKRQWEKLSMSFRT